MLKRLAVDRRVLLYIVWVRHRERLCLCGSEVVCLLREIVVYRTSQKQLRYLYPTCPMHHRQVPTKAAPDPDGLELYR
jgi:hypothetical protein